MPTIELTHCGMRQEGSPQPIHDLSLKVWFKKDGSHYALLRRPACQLLSFIKGEEQAREIEESALKKLQPAAERAHALSLTEELIAKIFPLLQCGEAAKELSERYAIYQRKVEHTHRRDIVQESQLRAELFTSTLGSFELALFIPSHGERPDVNKKIQRMLEKGTFFSTLQRAMEEEQRIREEIRLNQHGSSQDHSIEQEKEKEKKSPRLELDQAARIWLDQLEVGKTGAPIARIHLAAHKNPTKEEGSLTYHFWRTHYLSKEIQTHLTEQDFKGILKWFHQPKALEILERGEPSEWKKLHLFLEVVAESSCTFTESYGDAKRELKQAILFERWLLSTSRSLAKLQDLQPLDLEPDQEMEKIVRWFLRPGSLKELEKSISLFTDKKVKVKRRPPTEIKKPLRGSWFYYQVQIGEEKRTLAIPNALAEQKGVLHYLRS